MRTGTLPWLIVLLATGIFAMPPSRAQTSDTLPPYSRIAALSFSDLKISLERAGWPAAHIHALLDAEIQQRLNPHRPLQPSELRTFEFWRTGPDAQPLPADAARIRSATRQRGEEAARRALESLFSGSPPPNDEPALRIWEESRRWGSLPAEKRAAVSALLARAERQRNEFLHTRGGMLTRDEWARAWKITEDARSGLSQLLTAEELLDYDLRNAATAERMRAELDNFQPTRDEFISIFHIRHPLELRFADKPSGIDPALDQERADAESDAEKRIATLLGPQRHDDYLISLQPACQTLQFDGRFARADAATIRKLYRSLLATKARLAHLAAANPADASSAEAARSKDTLYREFRAVLDEEGTRRYLQEQGLWP